MASINTEMASVNTEIASVDTEMASVGVEMASVSAEITSVGTEMTSVSDEMASGRINIHIVIPILPIYIVNLTLNADGDTNLMGGFEVQTGTQFEVK